MKTENPKITTGVTLLRKLTLKSIIGFGRYYNKTVQQLLSMKREQYLGWAYYNLERITFTDDILLLIEAKKKITKPGIDVAAGEGYQKHLWAIGKNHVASKVLFFQDGAQERKTHARPIFERPFSKDQMRLKNQGHKVWRAY